MAYLLDIHWAACLLCSRPARVKLLNRYNEIINSYCVSHGEVALERMQQSEGAALAHEAAVKAAREAERGAS